jgi:hypothetical protein
VVDVGGVSEAGREPSSLASALAADKMREMSVTLKPFQSSKV